MKTIITLPIESRAETHRFYVAAVGLQAVDEPAEDGIVEPLQFKLGGEVDAVVARAERGGATVGPPSRGDDRVVSVTGGTIDPQFLDLGLLDEVPIDLVPVVTGAGNRPFFSEIS